MSHDTEDLSLRIGVALITGTDPELADRLVQALRQHEPELVEQLTEKPPRAARPAPEPAPSRSDELVAAWAERIANGLAEELERHEPPTLVPDEADTELYAVLDSYGAFFAFGPTPEDAIRSALPPAEQYLDAQIAADTGDAPDTPVAELLKLAPGARLVAVRAPASAVEPLNRAVLRL